METSTRLSQEQFNAVYSPTKDRLVVAGPGSGKTRVLVERIKYLAQESPNVVAITYTVAAAREVKDRLGGVNILHCGTLHSWCLKVIEASWKEIGFDQHITVLDDDQMESERDAVFKAVGFRGSIAQFENGLSAWMAGREDPTHPAYYAVKLFAKNLLLRSFVTYDTILGFAYRFLKQDGRSLGGLNLVVDEAQDANEIDILIYKLAWRSRFIVGDPDQSIYGFRGATSSGMFELVDPECISTLCDNYRSGKAITEAANNLISHNVGRFPKRTKSVTGDSGLVNIATTAESTEHECAYLCGIVTNHPDCAILCRYNREVELFTNYLKANHIPVRERRQTKKPTDWSRAKALLDVLANPKNTSAAYMLLSVTKGPEVAQKAVRDAVIDCTPLSKTLSLPDCKSPAETLNIMAMAGIDRESVEYVRCVMDRHSPQTLPELTMACNQDMEREVEEGVGVTVTTIHGAKGREWDTVILPEFRQDIIPGTAKDVEEARRLAYVAFTRAKRNLVILCTQGNKTPGGWQSGSKPSQFIKEATTKQE